MDESRQSFLELIRESAERAAAGLEPAPDSVDPAEVRRRAEEVRAFLHEVAEDRRLLSCLDRETRGRFLAAINRVAQPDRNARRNLSRALRRKEARERKQRDERVLEQTGIRKRIPDYSRMTHAPSPEQQRVGAQSAVGEAALEEVPAEGEWRELQDPRNCYTCKADFRRVHPFYDSLCPDCATLNWSKRFQSADLGGRAALLSGGRVKIGFQAGLKLLRAGCRLIVTTRFARDAAARYAAEEDFDEWSERLQIHGLDLRHVPSVEAFARHLAATEPRLDFIVHNACQTVRRPTGWYRHLMEAEERDPRALPESARALLRSYEQSRAARPALPSGAEVAPIATAGWLRAAELSKLELADEDRDAAAELFPEGVYDQDAQQIDLRGRNSWRLRLHEVSTVELLEVQMVNAVAPFVLNARLRPLMAASAERDKHIVNVSAMEGQFYRAVKTDKHPHTNMAKAALNMMTRTSAADYARDGIHMNSVDTGWITDEDPLPVAQRKRLESGFTPPLDVVDAAARILDPVFSGFLTGEHEWGKFFKDYQVTHW